MRYVYPSAKNGGFAENNVLNSGSIPVIVARYTTVPKPKVFHMSEKIIVQGNTARLEMNCACCSVWGKGSNGRTMQANEKKSSQVLT